MDKSFPGSWEEMQSGVLGFQKENSKVEVVIALAEHPDF